MPGRALAPEDLHPRQHGGGNLEMVYSGSNPTSDFKSAERVARGWFEITSTITPQLCDAKCYYQLIVSITKSRNSGIKDLI